MKRFFIIVYTLIIMAVSIVAQPRFTSNTEMYNFGQIGWKHPVTAQYIITNTGNRPLVLTEVEPDCACTVAQWTQKPIAPGKKGTVEVTFDAKALGHFQKSVAIYTNEQSNPVYLRFNGEVVMEVKDFTRTHPYLIGQIRIDRNNLDFPDIQYGERPVMHIGVVNLSDRPYEPVLMHLPSYLQMDAEPGVLQKGERGVITLMLNSEKLIDFGLTQTSVFLSRFSGDKVGDENEIPVSVVIVPDFSGMTEAEKANAPVLGLSTKDIDMSASLAKKSKAWQDITITNTGRSPLRINKLQVFHPAVGVNLKKSMLQPGESTRLRVTVVKKDIGKKRRHLRLLMITNDPMHPKVEINIKR